MYQPIVEIIASCQDCPNVPAKIERPLHHNAAHLEKFLLPLCEATTHQIRNNPEKPDLDNALNQSVSGFYHVPNTREINTKHVLDSIKRRHNAGVHEFERLECDKSHALERPANFVRRQDQGQQGQADSNKRI